MPHEVVVLIKSVLNMFFLSFLQVLIHYDKGTRKYKVPAKFRSIGHAISRGDETSVAATTVKSVYPEVMSVISKKISSECSALQSNSQSLFKRTDEDALKNWSSDKQEEELQSDAPTFLKCIRAAAVDKAALERDVRKSNETILPGIMSAAGVLLFCRSSHMNAHALMNGIILKRGGADSMTFTRLNHVGLSTSYITVTRKQEQLGENHDSKVLEWANQVAEEHHSDKEPKERHPGYQIVGDNLDIKVTARQATTKYQGSDYHMFNTLCIRNRVPSWHLPDDRPVADQATISTKEFLPTVEDDKLLRHDFRVLSGQIIAEHMPPLAFIKNHVPVHITHDYSTMTKKKSEVVSSVFSDFSPIFFLVSVSVCSQNNVTRVSIQIHKLISSSLFQSYFIQKGQKYPCIWHHYTLHVNWSFTDFINEHNPKKFKLEGGIMADIHG